MSEEISGGGTSSDNGMRWEPNHTGKNATGNKPRDIQRDKAMESFEGKGKKIVKLDIACRGKGTAI